MMSKKISAKGILLILYSVTIFLIGIIFVPCYEIWGPEKNVSGHYYIFLFNLMNDRARHNGFPVLYEIDYPRIIYTIGVITIISTAIWFLLNTWEKEDKALKNS